MSGDIYQVGVIPYQMLGGHLPYRETEWLTSKQLAEYDDRAHPDNTIFADECLKPRIKWGKLLDFETLNAWMPDTLRKIAKRACNLDPEKRFGSVGNFLAALAGARADLPDWSINDGVLTLRAIPTCYRVLNTGPPFQVQKRRANAVWRNDSTFSTMADLRSLVRLTESRR